LRIAYFAPTVFAHQGYDSQGMCSPGRRSGAPRCRVGPLLVQPSIELDTESAHARSQAIVRYSWGYHLFNLRPLAEQRTSHSRIDKDWEMLYRWNVTSYCARDGMYCILAELRNSTWLLGILNTAVSLEFFTSLLPGQPVVAQIGYDRDHVFDRSDKLIGGVSLTNGQCSLRNGYSRGCRFNKTNPCEAMVSRLRLTSEVDRQTVRSAKLIVTGISLANTGTRGVHSGGYTSSSEFRSCKKVCISRPTAVEFTVRLLTDFTQKRVKGLVV
jgi:hypothetical protein